MNLSQLKVGDIAKFLHDDDEFLVTERAPEDRDSGVTHIRYLLGGTNYFVWDLSDPEVEVTGKGRLDIRIVRL